MTAHFSHPAELSTPVVKEAIRRLRETGIQIRCQAPLINHINNDPKIWTDMWRQQVKLGMIPYYMFIERDTGAGYGFACCNTCPRLISDTLRVTAGARHYFAVPLYKAYEVYSEAIQASSGLARTARGPSMSCIPGKVAIQGIEEIAGEKVFVLKFLQSRNPNWNERIFFAEYNETAIWMNDLKPAFGEDKFFFEQEVPTEAVSRRTFSRSSLVRISSADLSRRIFSR